VLEWREVGIGLAQRVRLRNRFPHDRGKELALRREIVVEETPRDAGALRDLFDSHREFAFESGETRTLSAVQPCKKG
jgi:hypothetical protein